MPGPRFTALNPAASRSGRRRWPAGAGRAGAPPAAAAAARLLPLGLASCLLLSACERQPSPEAQRIEQLNLKIEQLENRINKLTQERTDGADRGGKPPAGVIKSLTIRTGTDDDRLRIYWSDGSTTDLPCTKEQATFVCG